MPKQTKKRTSILSVAWVLCCCDSFFRLFVHAWVLFCTRDLCFVCFVACIFFCAYLFLFCCRFCRCMSFVLLRPAKFGNYTTAWTRIVTQQKNRNPDISISMTKRKQTIKTEPLSNWYRTFSLIEYVIDRQLHLEQSDTDFCRLLIFDLIVEKNDRFHSNIVCIHEIEK